MDFSVWVETTRMLDLRLSIDSRSSAQLGTKSLKKPIGIIILKQVIARWMFDPVQLIHQESILFKSAIFTVLAHFLTIAFDYMFH